MSGIPTDGAEGGRGKRVAAAATKGNEAGAARPDESLLGWLKSYKYFAA